MKNDLKLKTKATLGDWQKYVAKATARRGFDGETVAEKFMLLFEECGELAKAARKTQTIKTDKKSEAFRLDYEFADVLFYLLDLCNKLEIDLEKAFRKKEEINKKRVWQ